MSPEAAMPSSTTTVTAAVAAQSGSSAVAVAVAPDAPSRKGGAGRAGPPEDGPVGGQVGTYAPEPAALFPRLKKSASLLDISTNEGRR